MNFYVFVHSVLFCCFVYSILQIHIFIVGHYLYICSLYSVSMHFKLRTISSPQKKQYIHNNFRIYVYFIFLNLYIKIFFIIFFYHY